MKQRIKNALPILLKIAFASALIYWLVSKDVLKWDDLTALLTFKTVLIGLGLLGLNQIVVTLRWDVLLRASGIRISKWRLFKLELIGMFFNYAIPGGVGGDLVKGYYTVQETPEDRLNAAMSILLDRVLGLYTMLILSITVMMINYEMLSDSSNLKSLALFSLVIFLSFTATLCLGFSKRIRDHKWMVLILDKIPAGASISKVYDGLRLYRNQIPALLYALSLSVIAQSVVVMFFLLVGQSMGFDYKIGIYFFAVPLGMIASSLPLAPAGIGVGQIAMLTLFNMYTPDSANLGAVGMTAFQVGFLVWGLLGAVFYLQRSKMKPVVKAVEGSR